MSEKERDRRKEEKSVYNFLPIRDEILMGRKGKGNVHSLSFLFSPTLFLSPFLPLLSHSLTHPLIRLQEK